MIYWTFENMPLSPHNYRPGNTSTVMVGNITDYAKIGNYTEIKQPKYGLLVLFIVPAITIFGNSLVVAAVLTSRSLKTSTNFLLLSLATADLLIGAIVMPFSIYLSVNNSNWNLPYVLCDVFIVADVALSTASICNLMVISMDRFIAVVRHMEYRTLRHRRRVYLSITVTWFFSLALALPLGIGLNTRPSEGITTTCEIRNTNFMLFGSIFAFYIPCLIMVTMYAVVFHRLRLQMKAVRLQEHAATQMVSFGENLDQMIASAHGGKHDIRGTMFNLAMPFINPQQKSQRGSPGRGEKATNKENFADEELSDEEDSTMSSNDLEELAKVFAQLQQVEENFMFSKQKQEATKFQQKRRAAEAVFSEWGQTAVRKFSNHLPQRFQQNFQRQQSVQRKTIERVKSIKLRALGLIMKLRSKQGMKVRKETRATKLVSIVLAAFLLCWLPFFTANVVQAYMITRGIDWTYGWDTVFSVCTWLGYLNSCLNPVIYSSINRKFRVAFYRILSCGRQLPSAVSRFSENQFGRSEIGNNIELHQSLVENEQVPGENDTDSGSDLKRNSIENGTVTAAALRDDIASAGLVAKVDPKATKRFIVESVSFHSDVDEVL